MAVDPDDIDDLPDLTPAQQLKLVRNAIANLLLTGQSYTVTESGGGRTKVSASLAELRKMEKDLEQQIDQASSSDGDMGLIQFGDESRGS